MSVHIGAEKGQIAETILLPGDPLRAQFIAETYLENPVCYNKVRGMFGFTGTYKGKRLSVQGTGMGMPSISIYAHELIEDYGVKNLIRVGTCGSYQNHINVGDLVIALGASTNSWIPEQSLGANLQYSLTASYDLLRALAEVLKKRSQQFFVGNVLSSDLFYGGLEPKKAQEMGLLAVEMEAAALYLLGQVKRVNTLCLLTVSDHLLKEDELSSQERQTKLLPMIEGVLDSTLLL